MKIKFIFIFIILLAICSCSVLIEIKTKKQKIARVLMNETQYPLSVDVEIYHNNKKITSTKSDNLGFFQFPYKNEYRNGLTFIIPNKELPDTIHNVNGYEYILYRCFSSDTFNLMNININDTIILSAKNCKLMIIRDKPFREH